MKKENTPWKEAALWICTKCESRERKKNPSCSWPMDLAETSKTQWKTALREKSLHQNLRVMTSSCLGLCPEGEQALLWSEKNPKENVGEKLTLLTYDPSQNSDSLKTWIEDWVRNHKSSFSN